MFTDLYSLELHGEGPRLITDTEGKLGAFSVSPDGSRIAWTGAVSLNDPIAQSLFVASLADATPANLTEIHQHLCQQRGDRSLPAHQVMQGLLQYVTDFTL